MCFSATASFSTAALTGVVGIAAISRTQDSRELPLAAVPLLFAIQQTAEGLLWLSLAEQPNNAFVTSALTNTFLLFALLIWPTYAPFAALTVESDPRRRKLIMAPLAIGVFISLYVFTVLVGSTNQALPSDGHIVYNMDPPPHRSVGFFYLVATGLGPALSSHRAINLLSILIVVGSVVAWIAYWEAFVSVWCLFAAASSLIIWMHFEKAREARRTSVAANN
jgi:hypothetical protein